MSGGAVKTGPPAAAAQRATQRTVRDRQARSPHWRLTAFNHCAPAPAHMVRVLARWGGTHCDPPPRQCPGLGARSRAPRGRVVSSAKAARDRAAVAFARFSVESQPVVAPPNARGDVVFFATLLRGAGSEGLFFTLDPARGISKGRPSRGPGAGRGCAVRPRPSPDSVDQRWWKRGVRGSCLGREDGSRASSCASGGKSSAPWLPPGKPAPGIPSGTLSNLDFPALNDRGDVAFVATVRRGRESVEAIYHSHGRDSPQGRRPGGSGARRRHVRRLRRPSAEQRRRDRVRRGGWKGAGCPGACSS